jgi:hypothetical protein
MAAMIGILMRFGLQQLKLPALAAILMGAASHRLVSPQPSIGQHRQQGFHS